MKRCDGYVKEEYEVMLMTRIPTTPFGRFIRERRLQLGMTIEDVAAAIGCSRAQLTRMELGTRNITNAKWILRLSSALSVPYDELAQIAGPGFEFEEGSNLRKVFPGIANATQEKAVTDFVDMITTRNISEMDVAALMDMVDGMTAFFETKHKPRASGKRREAEQLGRPDQPEQPNEPDQPNEHDPPQ